MNRPPALVQYWGGCPQTPNAKWSRFQSIVRLCAAKGWSTRLVWSALPDDPALVTPFREVGCKIACHTRSHANFDLGSVWRTYRMLRKEPCDVFHCHNVHTAPLIGAALANVPVRLWSKLSMSPYYEKGVTPAGIHRLAVSTRLSCALATRVLARARSVREELLRTGAAAGRISIDPVDVDVEAYRAAKAPHLREELGFATDDLIITTVGRAVPVKAWDILIPAFASIAADQPRARLLLVGETRGREESGFAADLQRRVAQLGLDGRVRFHGRSRQIPQLLAISDMFVLPSRSEGQPAALVEAFAAGLPCIATAVGGNVEVIASGHNGLLVERENVADLADAMRSLLADPAKRGRFAAAAAKAATRFNLAESTQRLYDLYVRLLAADQDRHPWLVRQRRQKPAWWRTLGRS